MSILPVLSSIVGLKPGQRHRLYETLLLYVCLIHVYNKGNKTELPDLESVVGKTPLESYKCFVNKLGQICDSVKGGKTVTSFAVLRPGIVEYWFASNQRTADELEDVKEYMSDLLRTVGEIPDDKLNTATRNSDIFSQILQKVVVFNRKRIEIYVRQLADELEYCVDVSAAEDTAEGKPNIYPRNHHLHLSG